MGCDITLHIEVKVNGKWEHWGCPFIKQDYKLFAIMAGVRNEYSLTPISQPKGLPEDLTLLTKMDYERCPEDLHDASWLGPVDIHILSKVYDLFHLEVLHTYLFEGEFTSFLEYPEDYPEGLEDVRFVFWFVG